MAPPSAAPLLLLLSFFLQKCHFHFSLTFWLANAYLHLIMSAMCFTPPDSLHMWSNVDEISFKNSWWAQGFSFSFVLTEGWKTWVWGTKTCVFWGQVFLYFKNTPCTCWRSLTSKRERVGGGGEEEALEESAVSSDERRTLWCLRRWSNRALHTLCSSSILGPAGTLHKHTQKHQNTCDQIFYLQSMPQLTDIMAPSSGRNESRNMVTRLVFTCLHGNSWLFLNEAYIQNSFSTFFSFSFLSLTYMWQLKGRRGIHTGNRIGVFLDACLDGRQVSWSDSAGAAAHMDWTTGWWEKQRLGWQVHE